MSNYIGRFAPSPTGLLHLGSLIGAVASYVDAKAAGGYWLLRIEDLDPPREVAGAAEGILSSLIAHGMQHDGEICWQSQRLGAYAEAMQTLINQGKAYYCTCTRADLQATHGVYSGLCRNQTDQPAAPSAIRIMLPDTTITLTDAVQGEYQQHLQREAGDVIVRRKDQLFAYQLAVVVDDAFQGITHIVRGSDLLDSTPRQIALQQLLNLPTPQYTHFPVITDKQGHKLSKQTFADAVCERDAVQNLLSALAFLKQPLPPARLQKNTQSVLDWAIANWDINHIPKRMAIAQSAQ